MDKQDWLNDLFTEEAKAVLPDKHVPATGWQPNMYLGTDSYGNVIVKEGSSGGGFSSDSFGGEVILPDISIDATLTQEGMAADAKVVGDKISDLSNYVTPQMFGAAADGVSDDTEAIQSALNTGLQVVLIGT